MILAQAAAATEIPVGKDKHLLVNGGYFYMDDDPAKRLSIGPTSLNPQRFYPVPQEYRPYYVEFKDKQTSLLWAGPSLKTPLRPNETRLVRTPENVKIKGNLAHVYNNSERLAIAIVGEDAYILAYTVTKRDNGIKINELRVVIDVFLKEFARSSISQATTALNLDGGGSIFVAWRKGGVQKVIAKGSKGDDGLPFKEEKSGGSRRVAIFSS